ncbi:DUF7222 domain-containing protein [Flavobacterium bizetiae]
MNDMISEFIYHADCKKFYIEHLDDLENIRQDLEDSLGEAVKKSSSPVSLHFYVLALL